MPTDPGILVTGGALQGPTFRELMRSHAAPPRPVLPPGSRMGVYEIEQLIGAGGAGTVYRGKRSDGVFAQSVAIKVVAAERSAAHAPLLEREILAALTHPAIARIYDGGELASGDVWFAMELVDGEPIDAHCRSRGLDLSERLALLQQVAAAAQHAHELQIVHRDIKAANVLVDRNHAPKLLDFGVASAVEMQRGTEQGAFTPACASPEQLEGGPVTAASDIYQLGLLIESVCAGALAASGWQAKLAARNVAAIIEKATQTDPHQRYASARDLASDLQRAAALRPAQHVAWRWPARAAFVAARHRIAATLLLILAGLLAATSAIQGVRIEREQRAAAEQRQRTASMTDFVRGMVQQAEPSLNSGANLRAIEIVDHSAARLRQDASLPPEVRLDLTTAVVEIYNEAGEPAKALELGRSQLDATVGAEGALLWRIRLVTMLADSELTRSGFDEAKKWIAVADAMLNRLGGEEARRERVLVDIIRGEIMETLGDDPAQVEAVLKRAMEDADATLPSDHRNRYLAHSQLGQHFIQSDPGKALALLESAERIGALRYARNHRFMINLRTRIGTVMGYVGRVEEAEAVLLGAARDGLEIPLRDGPHRTQIAFAYTSLASVMSRAKQYEKCISAAGQAIEQLELMGAAAGVDEYMLSPLTSRGRCLQKASRHQEALVALRRMLQIRQSLSGGERSFMIVDAMWDVAESQLALGDGFGADRTANAIEAALARLDAPLEPGWEGGVRLLLARARMAAGRMREARAALTRAEAVARSGDTPQTDLLEQIAKLRATMPN